MLDLLTLTLLDLWPNGSQAQSIEEEYRVRDDRYLAYSVFENASVGDLNEDGDNSDPVIHFLDAATGEVFNTKLDGYAIACGGRIVLFLRQGESICRNLSLGFLDPRSRTLHRCGLPAPDLCIEKSAIIKACGDWLQLNDMFFDLSALNPSTPLFQRGDANADSATDISDAVAILFHLFMVENIPCEQAGDVNDDGALDISDAVYVLSFLFLGGKAIEPPVGTCGIDPTGHALPCAEYPGCP